MDSLERIEDLERRIGALEVLAGWKNPWPRDEGPADEGDEAERSPVPDLRRLEDLRTRSGRRYVREDMRGAVTYSGAARLGDRELLWSREHGLPEIWDLEPADLARLLAALGHPARIALIRSLLLGSRTSQELQDVIGSSSAGQLYHHLKDLITVGVVDQAGRSRYQIAASRVVPLLVILAAAEDVARPQVTPESAVTTDKEG